LDRARHRRRPLGAVPVMSRMRVRLTFPPSLIQEPIIYRLVKDFDIVINIRRADVKADYGWVALEMEADEGTLQRGVAWLKERGVQVDPIERDVVVP
ncbi:MAG TPA: NIL domain-containing protein, partial [Methylomirabilota bacterium]|nr:NIL domain-containing protein [Methylomirabilota bacterium]